MGVAAISLPNIMFMFPGASIALLHQRWDDWVARDATVTTRKDQSEDTAGVNFELLRTRMVLRLASRHSWRSPNPDWSRCSPSRGNCCSSRLIRGYLCR